MLRYIHKNSLELFYLTSLLSVIGSFTFFNDSLLFLRINLTLYICKKDLEFRLTYLQRFLGPKDDVKKVCAQSYKKMSLVMCII